MSTPGPFGGDNPFGGMPFFGDLAKLFSSQGPVNWEVARQIATWLATEGSAEPNVDPLERMKLEELCRVADLHVSEATGLPTSSTSRALSLRTVTRSEWAHETLNAYRPLLEKLAAALAPAQERGADDAAELAGLLGGFAQMLNPLLLGLQSGFMVGHLAQVTLGQYEFPVPRPHTDQLLVVPRNVNQFAEDWSLPLDDLRLWICIHEVAHHTVLSRPHVRARLESLLTDYVGGFEAEKLDIEERLSGVDPSDPESLQRALGDAESLLGAMQSDAQRALLPRIEALTCVVNGYVDYVMDKVGGRLIGSYGALTEALRRRRLERGESDRFVERIFGLELGQRQYDRGAAFVKGVVERGGEDALVRLWHSERELPTPAEVDAPGLWLERIDLPE